MELLLNAIEADDRAAAKSLLRADTELVQRGAERAHLYSSGILHWLYVGDTALHLAAAGHRVEIVQLLVTAGADPNSARNHRRGRPLHYAADGYVLSPDWNPDRQVETIHCLLKAGAEVDAQDKNGATALHRAVRTRCAAAARSLISSGADPASKNRSGSTPFHLAVQNTGRGGSGDERAVAAQKEIIETFLTLGVSPKLKDGQGKSVFDCAKSGWIREILAAGAAD